MTNARGGRPQGPERVALWTAAVTFQAEGITPTFLQLANRAQVGRTVARITCWSMVRAGQFEVIGYARSPGAKRPAAMFRPLIGCDGAAIAGNDDGGCALFGILHAWATSKAFNADQES